MGVDLQALQFLLRSRKSVSFENFLMLGRQWCHVPRKDLERELMQSKPALGDIESAIAKALESHFIEPVLELLGASKAESLDFSDYEQATIVHDINQPIPDRLKARFSCVFDGGTLEHVFDFPRAMKNAMEMVAVGGHFLGIGPTNNYPGHGFYQFSPELYWRIFCDGNGFELEEVSVSENRRDAPCYRIDDPARIGARVQFTNSRPTYVMVRARRLRQAEIFKTTPQQPYYEAAWSPQTDTSSRRSGKESPRDLTRRLLPEAVKKILRPLVPQKRQLRFSGFKKI
jgi:hypothetical protein